MAPSVSWRPWLNDCSRFKVVPYTFCSTPLQITARAKTLAVQLLGVSSVLDGHHRPRPADVSQDGIAGRLRTYRAERL